MEERHCEFCGQVIQRKIWPGGQRESFTVHRRRRFCDRECASRGLARALWKGDGATKSANRQRAQKQYLLGPCEQCGAPGADRHHRDENTANNRPENIAILCRRCHMRRDGRLARLEITGNQNADAARKIRPCIICGRLRSGHRLIRGRCGACYDYLKQHGRECPEDTWRKRARP